MAIADVDKPGTRGWWFRKLAREQAARRKHQDAMWDRYTGNPPLPQGAENAREAFSSFQRKARSNYAEMIVEAVRSRQTPVGFRLVDEPTGADGQQETGDNAAAVLWRANEMAVESADVLEYAGAMGDGYMIVGPPSADNGGQAVMTAEDPRQVITAHDPVRQSRVRAALKTYFDEDAEQDVAYLYLPAGQPLPTGGTSTKATVHRATRDGKSSVLGPRHRFSPAAWTWKDDPAELATTRCNVVRIRNRHGWAEFEPHIDLLDRINHTILQGMVIVTMQAFRQRAAKGMPSVYPENHPLAGQEIDYEGIFTADPGAIWLLPETAEIWESNTGAEAINSILAMVKDHRQELATVSFTPFYNFNPDVANGSAAGAQIQREGLVFKVEDRNARAGIGFDMANSIAFELMADAQRAKPGALETLWAPVERFSLAEKYDAAVKAKAAGMPQRSIFIEVLQFPPDQADRMMRELDDDLLFGRTASAVQTAAALARLGGADQPARTSAGA